jgi:hypothetical protein
MYSAGMEGVRTVLVGFTLTLLAMAFGCASGGPPAAAQWSRVYARSFERVWEAALTTLAESGYAVEERDPARGTIRAESGERESYRRVVLEVLVLRRSESVRVDVQASGGGVSSPAGLRRLSRPVLAFLDDLDARLRS